MEIKAIQLIPKGMNQDLSISKFNPELSYENKNIRITARDNNSFLSIENEKGNVLLNTSITIEGICIGYAVLNQYLVLFTTQPNASNPDRIYLVADLSTTSLLFNGNLNFSINHPLETLPYFETESIQKVYWVDGVNQTRVINFKADSTTIASWVGNNDVFNFAPAMALNEVVTVTQQPTGGAFASGVIQYGFTYFNAYSPQTNLFHVTGLFSTGGLDRALSPEETSTVSFKIALSNLDPNFKYVRAYSIHKTSWNGIPTVKVVGDYLKEPGVTSLTIYDNGNIGYNTDVNSLIYLGGEDVILGSIAAKDNVFFGANITLNRKFSLDELLSDYKNPDGTFIGSTFQWAFRETPIIIEEKATAVNPLYPYRPYSLSKESLDTMHFKNGQYYRVGFQAQHQTGKWSEPMYLGQDSKCNVQYVTMLEDANNVNRVKLFLNEGQLTLPSDVLGVLHGAGYRKVRPVMVIPTLGDRQVLTQGLITNTLAWNTQRNTNTPFGIVDYLARPMLFDKVYNEDALTAIYNDVPSGSLGLVNFNHLMTARNEVQGVPAAGGLVTALPGTNEKPTLFIDQNLLNLWSPDIEYGDSLDPYLTENSQLKIIGIANITTSAISQFYEDSDGNTSKISGKVYNTAYDANMNNSLNSGAQALTNFDVPGVSPHIWPYDLKALAIADPATEAITLKNKNYALKSYALYNTFFNPSATIFTFPINKPIVLNTNDTYKVIPYKTNNSDANGNIIYAKHYDDLIFSPELKGTEYENKYTRFNYKSNTHLLFSLSDYIRETGTAPNILRENISRVLPGLLWNGQQDTSATLIDAEIAPPEITDAVDGSNMMTITATYKVKITGGEQMAAGDSINIRCSVFIYPAQDPGAEQDPNILYPQGGDVYMDTDDLDSQDVSTVHEITYARYLAGLGEDGFYTATFTLSLGNVSTYEPEYHERATEVAVSPIDHAIYYSLFGTVAPISFPDIDYPSPFWRSNLTVPVKYYKPYYNIRNYLYTPTNPAIINTTKGQPHFLIGEIIKPVDFNTLYGGNSTEALGNNLWIPCGKANKINVNAGVYSIDTLKFTEGDTYVRRYDCLRTFPDNEEQVNKVVNIASFLCESYVNTDGRYDRNRYVPDVTNMRLSNYGLLNSVNNQMNNFFNYRMLDPRMFTTQVFSNQITWTLEKLNGELVDSWANLTLLSTLDIDGNLGPINAIKTFNNEVVTFQDRGIARILFNSRVMVQTSDDTPIELANSGKVSGSRYITNQIGCKNKWSIKEAKSGLYFIDSLSKSINIYNGESVKNISVPSGFKAWSYNNLVDSNTLFKIDAPTHSCDLDTFITSYDRLQGDIYFNNKTNSLSYSETLEEFPSFYSYENTPYMFNILNNFIALKNTYDSGTTKYFTKLYQQNTGTYNAFFGTLQPSYIHYLINPEPTRDKVFNNIEFRADAFNMNASGAYLPNKTFTSMRTWNEYQNTNDVNLVPYSNLFKKFRIWRGAIPRSQGTMDRIRNPWTNLKLTFTPVSGENIKLAMHDLVVRYTT